MAAKVFGCVDIAMKVPPYARCTCFSADKTMPGQAAKDAGVPRYVPSAG
jgi:hypothetical protein